jgi:peptidoglycan-associated lipoprotein
MSAKFQEVVHSLIGRGNSYCLREKDSFAMKRSFYLNLLTVGLVLVLGGVGCKMKPKNPTPIPGAQTKAPGGTGDGYDSTGGKPVPAVGDSTVRSGPLGGNQGGPGGAGDQVPLITDATKENPDFFKANIVYFAFDRADVRPGERSKIEAVASHLKSNPTHKVRVEGNCDERGTEGYNLALGERRALAVREYLINLGVAADRVATISYGEARPAEPGHNEAAWAKNRRDEFVLLTP